MGGPDYPVDEDGFIDIGIIPIASTAQPQPTSTQIDDDGFLDFSTIASPPPSHHTSHQISFSAPNPASRSSLVFNRVSPVGDNNDVWSGGDVGENDQSNDQSNRFTTDAQEIESLMSSIQGLQARLVPSSISSSSFEEQLPPPPSMPSPLSVFQAGLQRIASTNTVCDTPALLAAGGAGGSVLCDMMLDPMAVLRSVEEAERKAEEEALSGGCIRSLNDLPSAVSETVSNTLLTPFSLESDNLVTAGIKISPKVRASHAASAVEEKEKEERASLEKRTTEEGDVSGIQDPKVYVSNMECTPESVKKAREDLINRLGPSLGGEMNAAFQEHLAKYANPVQETPSTLSEEEDVTLTKVGEIDKTIA